MIQVDEESLVEIAFKVDTVLQADTELIEKKLRCHVCYVRMLRLLVK